MVTSNELATRIERERNNFTDEQRAQNAQREATLCRAFSKALNSPGKIAKSIETGESVSFTINSTPPFGTISQGTLEASTAYYDFKRQLSKAGFETQIENVATHSEMIGFASWVEEDYMLIKFTKLQP